MATEKKTQTKRQHYVPRFLLRNFSENGQQIDLVVLSTGQRISGASIKTQCYEDYFYGDDGVMEKSFADQESQMSSFFKDMSPSCLEALSGDDLNQIRLYAHYQRARTLGAAEDLSNTLEAFAKSVLRSTIGLNEGRLDVSVEDLDLVRIRPTQPQNQMLWMASTSTPLLLDLDVKFIVTDRSPGFVISDHPVVANNQYAEHHPRFGSYPSITALSAKGLQWFLPLSPSVTLAVYDPNAYEMGGKGRICRAGPQDVDFLNQMQAVHAFDCLYYSRNRCDDAYLDSLVAARKRHASMYDAHLTEGDFQRRGDGTISQLIAVHNKSIRIGAKFSFIRLKDRLTYDGYRLAMLPVRSQELLQLTEEYRKYLEEEAKKRAAQQSPEPAPALFSPGRAQRREPTIGRGQISPQVQVIFRRTGRVRRAPSRSSVVLQQHIPRGPMIPENLDQWTLDAIRRLLVAGEFETDRFDFKQHVPRDDNGKARLRRTATSFANSDGGFLVFGVHDDRTLPPERRLVGIPKGDDFPVQLGNILRACEPSIDWYPRRPPVEIEGGFIHIVHVPRSLRGPHGFRIDNQWVFSKRTNAGTEAMSYAELQGAFGARAVKQGKLRFIRAELERIARLAEQTNIKATRLGEDAVWRGPLPPYQIELLAAHLPEVFEFIAHNQALVESLHHLREFVAESDAIERHPISGRVMALAVARLARQIQSRAMFATGIFPATEMA